MRTEDITKQIGSHLPHAGRQAEAGIDHIVMESYDRELDSWHATVEKIAHVGEGREALI